MDRLDKDNSPDEAVLANVSPALKYEAMLMECGGPGLNQDKTTLVFKVLDQIMPHLGVFVKLMKICRDELFEAVYSDQYTANKQTSPDKYIQRVPYFKLVKSVYDERDERNEQLTEQLDNVKERLFEKQKQFEDATDTIANLEENVKSLQEVIADLEENLKQRHNDVENLKQTLDAVKETAAEKEHELECDKAELQENLDSATSQNNYLKQFKEGYDGLQAAFADRSALKNITNNKKAIPATKESHLVSGIENCHKLELQLLTVQNSNIEEFDRYLETHKREVLERTSDDDELNDLDDVDIDMADQQLESYQEKFTKMIKDIDTELSLLRQHREGLLRELQTLEETKPSMKKKKKSKSRPATQESAKLGSLTEGLEGEDVEEGGESLDSFSIREHIFSKYAAMLYTSDNGKTFHEFRGAKYCQSCGEKTVLCPHKILKQEHTFILPPNVSHIKIIRPKVRINLELLEGFIRPVTSGSERIAPQSAGSHRAMSRVSLNAVSPSAESAGDSRIDSADISLGDSMHFTNTVQRLWIDFKARTEVERVVTRQFSCDQALSLVEEFAAHLVWFDEAHHEDEKPSHILDALYGFMRDRYHVDDMAYLVTYDLITALIEHCASNKFVWLFTQVLIGNLDASVFRYMLLIGDYINQVDWQTVEDFRAFCSVIYPSLTEDDIETLQMGYISFSENKISRSLVAEYIIYIIMKYREPRFLEMENALLARPHQNTGFLSLAEFIEATDAVLDVPNNKLRKRLFGEALAYVTSKDNTDAPGVPNLRLSQICSYLQLLHISPLVMENVKQAVETARETSELNDDGKAKPVNAIPSQFKVIGMSDVKVVASNMARRSKCRKLRIQAGISGS